MVFPSAWSTRAKIGSAMTIALLFGAMISAPRPAAADSEPQALVEKSRLTAEKLMTDPELPSVKAYIKHASGILIIPQLVKGGFVIGGEGGSGVLLAHASDGSWSSPAFYTMAGGSIGLQIGGQVSEVVLTIMNEKALGAVLASQFKLGADASIAVGPVGAGVGASTTTNLDADIYAFSRAVGLFGGASLQGAGLFPRKEWNEMYYGPGATPRAIVLDRRFFNKMADPLREALPR